MVTVEYMICAALRKDTAISRAMLRACGVPVPHPRPCVGMIVGFNTVRFNEDNDIVACFTNHGSPMDVIHGF